MNKQPTLLSHTQIVPTLRDCQAAQANRTIQNMSISVSFSTQGRKKRNHDCLTLGIVPSFLNGPATHILAAANIVIWKNHFGIF